MQQNDTNNGVNFKTIQASALGFPFITYWYENGKFWELDDRPNVQNTSQMVRGLWQAGLPTAMKAMAVKTTFDITIFYDSDQDARIGFEKLLWEYNPKGPIQFTSSVTWKNTDISIPTFFTIESFQYNPEYKEGDWLKKQRILPINLKITLRTYILYYPYQVDLLTNQIPETSVWNTGAKSDADNAVYITERVLLAFAESKAWTDASTTGGADGPTDLSGNPEEINGDIIPSQPVLDSTGTTELQDVIQGYFEASTDIMLDLAVVPSDTITESGFLLKWEVSQESLPNLAQVKILIQGRDPIIIDDPSIKEVWITGLYPNSQYSVVMLFYSIGGRITDFHLTVTTLAVPGQHETPDLPQRRRLGPLKGTTWGSKPVER